MAAEKRPPVSVFHLASDFFDSAQLFHSHISALGASSDGATEVAVDSLQSVPAVPEKVAEPSLMRWGCNTCHSDFDSLLDQRAHFKSDFHRLNVKRNIAGKKSLREEDFEAITDSVCQDFEVSSVSGSEDELENCQFSDQKIMEKVRDGSKQKFYLHLHSGTTVSLWKCLLLDETEELLVQGDKPKDFGTPIAAPHVAEEELFKRLKYLLCEPRDKTHLRIVLLTSGGHFAGSVFDGDSIVVHKTFHRYVVRAKAGGLQSSKDATGKVAHSAGSALRRYNESALKKEIQDLIVSWKPYFDSCKCIFVHAPSKSRQMLFEGDKCSAILSGCNIRHVPLTVRRPTLKEVKRLYNNLTQVTYEIESALVEKPLTSTNDDRKTKSSATATVGEPFDIESITHSGSHAECSTDDFESSASEWRTTTPLHEAAVTGNSEWTLELLEEGLDPCIRDERGRTPYMLATEKEVRNTFRRFMALNLDKWDWHAANVPSPLTKEMEESQAAKQAEKDAKRKAKAKELKKLKKAKEKAKLEAQVSKTTSHGETNGSPLRDARETSAGSTSRAKLLGHVFHPIAMTEEARQKVLAEEREKRAAAAERRMAATEACKQSESADISGVQRGASDVICSFCSSSLAGKIPFHRYNYKYCSTTCMHMHRDVLEDG